MLRQRVEPAYVRTRLLSITTEALQCDYGAEEQIRKDRLLDGSVCPAFNLGQVLTVMIHKMQRMRLGWLARHHLVLVHRFIFADPLPLK